MITDRETKILEALASGLTQQEIAFRKGWHLNTVHTIVAELKIKLDCQNLFQLGMKATVYLHKEKPAA